MKKVVFVIAERNFRDEELLIPIKLLKAKQITCVICSKTTGLKTGKMGGVVESVLQLHKVKDDFDALVFVGGPGAAEYFDDENVFDLVKRYYSLGKIVAAICIAPTILANAGVLKGKKATSFASEKIHLDAKGAIFTGASVEVDGKIITANGPESAELFAKELIKALK